MAVATYTGPDAQSAFEGFTFYRGQPRPLPDEVAERLAMRPLFDVEIDKPKRKPGRPRKGEQ